MKRTTVSFDEDQALRLDALARREGRARSEVLRDALDEYLSRHGLLAGVRVLEPRRSIPEDVWRARLSAAVDRVRASVPPEFGPVEIEAEISAAREEVRRARADQRALTGV